MEAKACPIAFEEALLKLASSATIRSQLPMVRRAAGPEQYGVYHSGGATQLVWLVKCHMAAQPDHVVVACDIRNGFGAATRSAALTTASKRNPGLCGLFANLWGGRCQPQVWMSTEHGPRCAEITDGFLQGACEAPVAFAYALRTALEDFRQRCEVDPGIGDAKWRLWAYVDDMTLQAHPSVMPFLLQHLRAALADHCLHLRPDKCTAFCPAAAGDPRRIAEITDLVKDFARYTPAGLGLLGTVSEGAFATYLPSDTKDPDAAHPAETRACEARSLIERIVDLCGAHVDGRRLSPAWKLLAVVANNALSFDCCVLPPGLLRPHAIALDSGVAAALPQFTGGTSTAPETEQRIRLPRTAGGCDLPTASQRSYTSFLSQYLAVIPGVIRDLTEKGHMPRPAVDAALQASGLLPAALEAQEALQHCGLELDPRRSA